MPTFYEILGVDKTATLTDIKKKYRRASLEHHPDKNGGNDIKFKKINEAYQILSDPEKRKEYDFKQQFGNNGGMMGHNPQDIFNMMFRGGNAQRGMPFFNMFPGNNPNVTVFHNGVKVSGPGFIKKPTPIVKTIQISLEKAFTGCQHALEIERWIQEDDNMKRVETETIYIDIPAGIDNNELIILRSKGNIINDDNKGDLKVFIKIQNETHFRREGLNLFYTKQISLKESLCGFKFDLKFMNGKTFTIDNTNGLVIKPFFKKVLQQMGMRRNDHKGDLIIEFVVDYPDTLSQTQREALNKIL